MMQDRKDMWNRGSEGDQTKKNPFIVQLQLDHGICEFNLVVEAGVGI